MRQGCAQTIVPMPMHTAPIPDTPTFLILSTHLPHPELVEGRTTLVPEPSEQPFDLPLLVQENPLRGR